jgi:hypothetical protein
MQDIIGIIGAIIVLLLAITLGYFFWVGVFWLINAVFGTTLNIWWGGLFGLLIANLISNIK